VKHKIFVTVQGGRAEVCEDTVPAEVEVEILDFDHLRIDPDNEMSCWSQDIREHWLTNHRSWGRCGAKCPCRSAGQ